VSTTGKQLQPGRSIDLTGQWLYKPGYLVQPDEQPQLAEQLTGYVAVPVPQLLNRTHSVVASPQLATGNTRGFEGRNFRTAISGKRIRADEVGGDFLLGPEDLCPLQAQEFLFATAALQRRDHKIPQMRPAGGQQPRRFIAHQPAMPRLFVAGSAS